MIRNLRCTVTIDSVLATSKKQNAFLFTVNASCCHDYPLAVEPKSTPRPLVQKKLGLILYPLICSFLPCLSWLLRSRVRKSRRVIRKSLRDFRTRLRHFSSLLPPSGGTCKYATAPSTKKTWRDSLPIDMLLSAVSVLVVAQSSSEIPEGLMNNPVYCVRYYLWFHVTAVGLRTY